MPEIWRMVKNQEFDCTIVSDDGTLPENSKIVKWARLWNQSAETIGKTGRCYPQILANVRDPILE